MPTSAEVLEINSLIDRALGALKDGRYDEAKDLIGRAQSYNQVVRDLEHTRAIYLYCIGDQEQAACALRKELEAFPDNQPAKELLESFGQHNSFVSELDKLIPAEVKDDPFYHAIAKLAAEEKIGTILEIGSSSGAGSTEAFFHGINANPNKPILYCIEVSRARFEALSRRYGASDRVRCFNVSSVNIDQFPSEKEIIEFYHRQRTALNNYPVEQVLGWLRQDIEYVKQCGVQGGGINQIKSLHNISSFDMVLIDGSEFSGRAELDLVYGAGWILLDDINGFKNYQNYQRLAGDCAYQLVEENWNVRNGYAIFKRRAQALPIHFFTLVLNGMPFMRHHIDEFNKLTIPWHWHIIEGMAQLKHDTAWSVSNGGRVSEEFHRAGLSIDGTSEYIDELAKRFPGQVSVYRKGSGLLWEGKLEMVNAPVPRLTQECLLWEVDSDELWTGDQIHRMHELFETEPHRTAAFFHCDYFVGPKKYVSSLNTWATYPWDWVRAWRFKPGMRWAAHEPPKLVDQNGADIAYQCPFTRDETKAQGITFQHFAYTTPAQVKFKEVYYGYKDALKAWERLQNTTGKVRPADYLPWAKPDATVEDWDFSKGALLGEKLLGEKLYEQPKKYSSMSVEGATQFEREVRTLFQKIRPRKVIETGTYLGRGTSTIIHSALRDLGIDADFTTIEVNPEHHRLASLWFAQNGMQIRAELGLSLPRAMLPSIEDIHREFVENREFEGIYYDHDEATRSQLYFAETGYNVSDDLLYKTMQRYDFRPDFVLLDSAGHVGYLEFEYFMKLIKGPCHVMLDDIYHCKHYKTLQAIKRDPRFTILVESPEKFGFCIVKYSPANDSVRNDVNSLLWIRTDSIGDNVLASGMLPAIRGAYPKAKITVLCAEHCSELYEACPFTDEIVGFDRKKVLTSEQYRAELGARLKALNFDLALNSVYSREPLTDFFAIQCGATERIALHGDLANISSEDRDKHNKLYTRIITFEDSLKSETQRHRDFLQSLGVSCEEVRPMVWIKPKEEGLMQELCNFAGISRERTIALFAVSQWQVKQFHHFAEALAPVCQRNNFNVVALGSADDCDVSENILKRLNVRTLNVCGKTNLRQTAALLKRCRLAVGVDTAGAHLACAVQTPNVVVLGGGHFGRFLPYSALTSVVCLPLECYWCNWQCRFSKPHCIQDIAPESVTFAIEQTLQNSSDRARIFVQARQPSLGRPLSTDVRSMFHDSAIDFIDIPCVGLAKSEAEPFTVRNESMRADSLTDTY